MANSKTNIYPIQLQGAELNLNKFDAEIKQYSGFNKNNSPFVGGCLSNVFNKDVTIEGSNSKNTYIAPNGDVYQITEYGLQKNGEYILSFFGEPSRNKFWTQKEIPYKENVVRMFSENIYLTYEVVNFDNKLVLHAFDNTYEIASFTNIDPFEEDLYCYRCATGAFISTSEGMVFFFAYRHSYTEKTYAINVEDGSLYDLRTATAPNELSDNYPVSICYSHNQVSVFAMLKNSYTMNADFYSFTKEDGFEVIAERVNSFSSNLTSSEANVIWPPLGYLRVCGYPFNSAAVYQTYSYTGSTVNKKVVDSVNGLYYASGGVFVGSYVKLDIPVIRSIKSLENIQRHNIEDGEFTSMCSVYDMQYQFDVSSSSTENLKSLFVHHKANDYNLNGVRLVDDTNAGNSIKRGIYAYADAINLLEDVPVSLYLLFNNNRLSGISGEQVLFTDWNSVELKTLCLNNRELCFKNGDKWYILKQGSPELRLINNQIVTNKDARYNSYDIIRNKLLLYAPSHNGVWRTVRTLAALPDNSIENNFWLATAINEYNLQDNASILLNPVNLYMFNQGADFANSFSLLSRHYVNFYSSIEDTVTYNKIKYWISRSRGGDNIVKQELIGLPFPIDTNGNVMYSPCLFSEIKSSFGNNLLIKNGNSYYPLVIGNDNTPVMSFYLASGIEGLQNAFIIQGQYYGIINNQIYTLSFSNGVINSIMFIVNVQGLQFCGNTPYEALFYSKTNRCLYSFTGANVLTQRQLVDKISEVKNYLYNPATQTVFLITDIGVFFYGIFGQFLIEYTDIADVFLLDNGIVLGTDAGLYHYIKYYLDEGDEDYQKNNIKVDTCFYGMNNETVTINDCLYFRLFSEEHEEGNLEVQAVTVSLEGRKTEKTVFRIRKTDWDKETNTIYLRYQPKQQRGLGISFKIDSPFKIASLSVGSQADAILVDKVSKGAINKPQMTSNNVEW